MAGGTFFNQEEYLILSL